MRQLYVRLLNGRIETVTVHSEGLEAGADEATAILINKGVIRSASEIGSISG